MPFGVTVVADGEAVAEERGDVVEPVAVGVVEDETVPVPENVPS